VRGNLLKAIAEERDHSPSENRKISFEKKFARERRKKKTERKGEKREI